MTQLTEEEYNTKSLEQKLKELDYVLECEGYKEWTYSRLTISEAIKQIQEKESLLQRIKVQEETLFTAEHIIAFTEWYLKNYVSGDEWIKTIEYALKEWEFEFLGKH